MQPDSRDVYENGDVQLYVDHFNNPLENKYWVSGSVGSIQFTEQGFEELIELIKAYDEETSPAPLRKDDPWQFWTIVGAIIAVVFIVLVMVV